MPGRKDPFNISEMRLSITSLFSVQIMSYLGASNMIQSDGLIVSDIEIQILNPRVLAQKILDREIRTVLFVFITDSYHAKHYCRKAFMQSMPIFFPIK